MTGVYYYFREILREYKREERREKICVFEGGYRRPLHPGGSATALDPIEA